jgi:hypothetical protein
MIEAKVVKAVQEVKGVTFMAKVKGTGPEFVDAYRC